MGNVGETAYSLCGMLMTRRYRCHVFLDLSGIVWMTFMTLGAITFVDFVIASSLCYLLATSRTGFTR